MTNPAARPNSVEWYAARHSQACLLVQSILSGMQLTELGSFEYETMYNALTSANESARALYDMFCVAAKRDMEAVEAAKAAQAASDLDQLRSQ